MRRPYTKQRGTAALPDFKEFRLLVEVQGPFVATGVLRDTFPQGFPKEETLSDRLRQLRLSYGAWQDAHAADLAAQSAWIQFVLTQVLEFEPDTVTAGQAIPQSLRVAVPGVAGGVAPSLLITTPREEDLSGSAAEPGPLIPIFTVARTQKLEKPFPGEVSRLTAIDRAIAFLQGTKFPLALLTNGEQWAVVHTPQSDPSSSGATSGVTSTATWYAEMWLEEPVTYRAFQSLVGARRWFHAEPDATLPKLLERSALNQAAVTAQLGRQVRQAVMLLISALDRADQDHNRGLLSGVPEPVLYEAALSVMMRLIFLFFAEERELLPSADPLYAAAYAVSTIREQLQAEEARYGPEVLERRKDAWSRLLATFRAVHAGLGHDRLTLPAYGGQLFDPDRFPFLEGRAAATSWRDTPAAPLPVDNRTVFYALEALQILRERAQEPRPLTFRELDVPDIGHVYESLLDHTAKRASEVTLGLIGSDGSESEAALSQLEGWREAGTEKLTAELAEYTGKSARTLSTLLAEESDVRLRDRIRTACRGDEALAARVLPFAHIVRLDPWHNPVIILPGSVFVTAGTDRRSTGTHYTPTSLTEPIVQYTLEPVVYVGPADGTPREKWQLKPPAELLALKICDMACGSGAFLVAAARYLAARVEEAWEEMGAFEPGSPRRSPEGFVSDGTAGEDLIPLEAEERNLYALRVVAQRCLYGVDKNPLAAEMAKLSLWLLTLAKGKPFTFLDHAIKSGDSLIGVTREQLEAFDLDDTNARVFGFGPTLDKIRDKRETLAMVRAETVAEVDRQARMLADAEEKTEALRWVGDTLIGMELRSETGRETVGAELAIELMAKNFDAMRKVATRHRSDFRPFHWPLEFPEVFDHREGFDAVIGNPPFIGGQKITGLLGRSYREFLVSRLAGGQRGSADYSAYFFLRARMLLRPGGAFGLLATNTIAQGDTREVGLDQVISDSVITRAIPSRKWPGEANLEVAYVWVRKGAWSGGFVLDGSESNGITPLLTVPGSASGNPYRLRANEGKSFIGSYVLGMGFVLEPDEAQDLIARDPRNADVLLPYLNGEDLNSRPDQSASRWVINFRDWPLERAEQYPDCMRIVREKVKPERDRLANGDATARDRARRWWQFARPTRALYATIAGLDRVLVRSAVSNTNSIAAVTPQQVFSHAVVVFGFDSRALAILQSSIHDAWLSHFASSMRTDVRYTPSDCFETLPRPYEQAQLSDLSECYSLLRQDCMFLHNLGLTKIYALFNSSACHDSGIDSLRAEHIQLDQAVAAAYGWTFDLGHGFHETKQGIRFTISPQARAKVLDLLLALNHKRYAAEQRALASAPKRKAATKKVARPSGAPLLETV